MELQFTPVPVKLDENCTVAIVAYTHDLMLGSKQGNLYFELNTMLRKRKPATRTPSSGRLVRWCGRATRPCFDT